MGLLQHHVLQLQGGSLSTRGEARPAAKSRSCERLCEALPEVLWHPTRQARPALRGPLQSTTRFSTAPLSIKVVQAEVWTRPNGAGAAWPKCSSSWAEEAARGRGRGQAGGPPTALGQDRTGPVSDRVDGGLGRAYRPGWWGHPQIALCPGQKDRVSA